MPEKARGRTSPAALADACRRYAETDEPAADIAARLGIGLHALRCRMHRRGVKRFAPPPPAAPAAAAGEIGGDDGGACGPAARVRLIERIRGGVEREIASLDRLLAAGTAGQGLERSARTLASLVRSLRELKALDEADAAPAPAEGSEEMPRDLDEFRRALAERLARLARERDA